MTSIRHNIAVLNRTTNLSDLEALRAVKAMEKQCDNHFEKYHGIGANFTFFPRGADADPKLWSVVLLDNADTAGALGYHDLNPNGLPIGKVFVETCKAYKASWTVCLSHEVLEMLLDPLINLVVMDERQSGVEVYAYEACDACEADELGYRIVSPLGDGIDILVSDFALPAYFNVFASKGPYTFRESVFKPLGLAAGGYASKWTPTGGWQQIFASDLPAPAVSGVVDPVVKPNQRPNVGSRRERRRTPREQWLRSDA